MGNFVEHVVGTSKNKGLKTHFKSEPNPLQKQQKPTQTSKGHNPEWICA
jgi:hypothetical protein